MLITNNPAPTSKSSGTSLANVLNMYKRTPALTPRTFTAARNVNNAMMNTARGMDSPRIGTTMAIESTMITVIAASASAEKPNQNRIDAINPTNGPNASST